MTGGAGGGRAAEGRLRAAGGYLRRAARGAASAGPSDSRRRAQVLE